MADQDTPVFNLATSGLDIDRLAELMLFEPERLVSRHHLLAERATLAHQASIAAARGELEPASVTKRNRLDSDMAHVKLAFMLRLKMGALCHG